MKTHFCNWKVELNLAMFFFVLLESWNYFTISQKHPFSFPDGFGREWLTKTSGSGKDRHWQQHFPACLARHITRRRAESSCKYIFSEGWPEIVCIDTTEWVWLAMQPQRRRTGGAVPPPLESLEFWLRAKNANAWPSWITCFVQTADEINKIFNCHLACSALREEQVYLWMSQRYQNQLQSSQQMFTSDIYFLEVSHHHNESTVWL